MYQTKIKGDILYRSVSQGYGAPVELFGDTGQGETPMSLVNIALASCVTMCVQGYYKKYHQLEELAIETTGTYVESSFQLTISLSSVLLAETDEDALLAYADKYCRVKQLLKEEVVVELTLKGVN